MQIMRIIPILMIPLFISCGKERSFEQRDQTPDDTTGTPGNTSGLLIRMVTKYNNNQDSSVSSLQYDSEKRLIRLSQTSPDDNHQYIIDQSYRYYRNASGLVERYVEYMTAKINNNIMYEDSVVYHIHLNGDKYDYALRDVPDIPNPPIKDSIIYGYDANGRINTVHIIRFDGNTWAEYQKALYTYDANGNITQVALTFEDQSDPPQVIKIQYSDKSTAANFGNEMLFDGLFPPGFCGPNSIQSFENPEGPDKFTFSYEYNSSGKPVKGTQNDIINGGSAEIYYYYQ